MVRSIPLPQTVTGRWHVHQNLKTHLLPGLTELNPIVNRTGSDSSSLRQYAGNPCWWRYWICSVRYACWFPPAWQNVETLDADLRAFYEFNSKHMEAWDGRSRSGHSRWSSCHFVCLTVMVYVQHVG